MSADSRTSAVGASGRTIRCPVRRDSGAAAGFFATVVVARAGAAGRLRRILLVHPRVVVGPDEVLVLMKKDGSESLPGDQVDHPARAGREEGRGRLRGVGEAVRRLQRHPRGGLSRRHVLQVQPVRLRARGRRRDDVGVGAERQGRHRHQEVRREARRRPGAGRPGARPARAAAGHPPPRALQRVRQPPRLRDQARRPGHRSTPATAASSR